MRSAHNGALRLREITGTVTVGQQHPAAPVFAPMSPDAVRFEESRFQVCWTVCKICVCAACVIRQVCAPMSPDAVRFEESRLQPMGMPSADAK